MRLLSALLLTHCFSCVFSEEIDDEIKNKTMYISKSQKNMLKRNPYTSVSNVKESKYTQNGLHQYFWSSKNFKRYRKLLSYSESDIGKDFMTNKRFLGTNVQSHEEKQRAFVTENVKDAELWDEWNNWSTCSASCGSGRQVRWRHCLAENCTKGLKKAQIKACQLKDCNPNTILHWLGIKH